MTDLTNTPAIKAAAADDVFAEWALNEMSIEALRDEVRRYRAALTTPAIQAVAPILPDAMRVGKCVAIGSNRIIIATAVTVEWADKIVAALAAVPAQQPDVEGVKLTCCKDSPALMCVGDYYCGRAAAPVAPDLASLTRWEFGFEALRQDKFGDYVLLADVERLLSHSAQAPAEQVSALTDERDIHILLRELLGIAGSNRRGACARLNDMHNLILSFKSKRALLAASPKVEPVSEDKRDAERYRHMRNLTVEQAGAAGQPSIALPSGLNHGYFITEENADFAVDESIKEAAALAATSPPTGEK